MTPWQEISRVADGQHGLFTLQQALVAGLSADTIQRHVRQRGLERPARGVLALPGSADTPQRRMKAVELAVGPPALICGWSAAFLWGLLPAAPTIIDVMVPMARKAPALRRVRATRCSVLTAADHEEREGIAVTAVPMTLLVIARTADLPFTRALVIDARQRRLTDLPALRARVNRLGRTAGTARIRRVLRELDEQRPDSVFEHLVRERLRGEPSLPQPDPEPCAVPLPEGRVLHVDVPYGRYRLGVECDGLGSHQERAALDKDALRSNAFAEVDWLILRITWSIYERHWPAFVAQLQRLLDRRARDLRLAEPEGEPVEAAPKVNR